MSKIIDWVESSPNNAIVLSIAITCTMLFGFFLTAWIVPDTSYTDDLVFWDYVGFIPFIGFLISVFIGTPIACAKVTDMKNRSFLWVVLFLLCPLIGLVCILSLDDKSEPDKTEEFNTLKAEVAELRTRLNDKII